MALRWTAKNVFAYARVPHNYIIKKSIHLGSRLKSRTTQPKLSNVISNKFWKPFKKGDFKMSARMESDFKMSAHMASDRYIYRVATVDDSEAILELLRTFYYPEEPLTMGQDEKQQNNADEEYTMSLLQHGASFIAIDKIKDKIIGVIMADILTPTSTERKLQEAERLKDTNKQWSKVLTLLAYLEKEANLFERYKVEKALDYFAVTVDKDYRGKEVTMKMVQATEDNARLLGYSLLTTMCTSYYTMKLCQRLKSDCVLCFKYSDYKDSNGKPVFNPPPPHTHFAMYAKLLK